MRRRLLNPKNRQEALKVAALIWGDPNERKAGSGKPALQNSQANISNHTGAHDIANVSPPCKERDDAKYQRR